MVDCRAPAIAACPSSGNSARFPRFDSGPWLSPDAALAARRIRYLQLGGDTWNRCGIGWLNADGAFDEGDGAQKPNRIYRDETGRFIMRHEVSKHSRLPFRNGSFQLVYSEHMLEHMLPISGGGINFLAEAYRVLAPGGVLRIVTPDLGKYACALVTSSQSPGFLESHGSRFPPIESLSFGRYPSRAGMLNNLFRNYGHEWLYDWTELSLLVRRAGLPGVCRSDRAGAGLPRWTTHALKRANEPRNRTQQCWLDQHVRAPESLYAVVIKPS